MFRKVISATTALSIAFTAIAPLPARADEAPLPLNRVWKGVILCTDGPRGFTLLTPSTTRGPLYIVELGPRKKDGADGQSGLMVAHVKPDPRGITLIIDRVLVPISGMPKMIGGHLDPGKGTFYGGVSDSLDGSSAGNPQCNYLEANIAADQESRNHLQVATTDPQGYLREMARALITPPEKAPTPGDWAALALAFGAVALMFGQAAGHVPSSPGSGLHFSAPGAGHPYERHDGDGMVGPDAGGDVHGNPWQGTGTGPGLGNDIHGH